MIPPYIKLGLMFAKVAQEHGPKLLHLNNPDLLTRDLGAALKKQKDVLSDPRKNMFMTGYDVVPLLIEVKILTTLVAKRLGVDGKGKPDIAVLEEIIAKADARNGGLYAKDIEASLEWTRKLFANPEIQDVLQMEMTEIEKVRSYKDMLKFLQQVFSRGQDEVTRVTEFLRRAKDIGMDEPQKNDIKKSDGPKN